MTDSKKKELERKRRYYWKHKVTLTTKQNEYDAEHKIQTHLRSKFHYITKKKGASKTYMTKDVKDISTGNTQYYQLSNDE
jgi:hypothetical protein